MGELSTEMLSAVLEDFSYGDAVDVDSADHEFHGKDEQGREGSVTFNMLEICGQAALLIKRLEQQKTESIFEVRDTSDEDMYFPMGVFASMAEVQEKFEIAEASNEPLTERGSEGGFEEISVYEHKFGWSDGGTFTLKINREEYCDEKDGASKWRLIK